MRFFFDNNNAPKVEDRAKIASALACSLSKAISEQSLPSLKETSRHGVSLFSSQPTRKPTPLAATRIRTAVQQQCQEKKLAPVSPVRVPVTC